MKVSTAGICTVSPANICPASTANICHVSAADIFPVSTAQDHDNARVHLLCRSQGLFIFESPHSLAYFWLAMAKAEPWEKHYYRKISIYMMGVHNLHRKENKDILKLYESMDLKRKKRYMKILLDALPRDFNAVELCHQECNAVTQEWLNDNPAVANEIG